MVVFLHAAVGFALGWLRPPWGLALLIGVVAVTSSLWWHVGLDNSAYAFAYLLAFLFACATRSLLARREAGHRVTGISATPDVILLASILTVTCMAVATLLAILRRYVGLAGDPATALLSRPSLLFAAGPGGVYGDLQTALIAIAGPTLLVAATVSLSTAAARRIVVRAFVAGAGFVAAAPVAKALFPDPEARPDGLPASGLIGFFQDPHSHAAYLVLSTTIGVGLAIGYKRRGDVMRTLACGALAVASFVVLLYTNSRAGLISVLFSLACLIVIAARSETASPLARRRQRKAVAVILVATVLLAATLAFAPTRRALHDQLVKLGNERMWALLNGDPTDLLDARLALVRRAGSIIATRPIWGGGPNAFEHAPAPHVTGLSGRILLHPHNYFAQLASEYGMLTLMCFMSLGALLLIHTISAASRRESPVERGLLAGIAAGQIGILTISLASHPLLLAELQGAFWTLAALGVATAGSPDPQSRSSRSRPASNPKNGSGGENGLAPSLE